MGVVETLAVKACVLCLKGHLTPFLNLGDLPLPNRLPSPGDPPDSLYRLDVSMCDACGHVQLGHVVPPELMFFDYSYVPSTSVFLTEHFRKLALKIAAKADLSSSDIALDIGGNDGLLASFFPCFAVNVDPASNLAQASRARGVPMFEAFWGMDAAEHLFLRYGKFAVITATNCLAHTAGLSEYLRAVEYLLANDGYFVVEAPYLWNLVARMRYDTIYHEHQSYFSVAPLAKQLPKYGLRLDAIEHLDDVHGGSMRYWIRKAGAPAINMWGLNTWEAWASHEPEPQEAAQSLRQFASKVSLHRGYAKSFLQSLDGRVTGIGASAKAAVTLNYCGIGTELIECIGDASYLKQGYALPGVRIPIVPEDMLVGSDYVVDFIWNLRKDVMDKLARIAPKAELVELLK